MIILGVDSSLDRPGFALVEVGEDRKPSLITTCAVDNKNTAGRKKSTAQKIQEIARVFHKLCELYKPDVIVRERAFSRFVNSTQMIFRVVGAIDLVAYDSFGKEIEEITPRAVKKFVTGEGAADKDFVAESLDKYIGRYFYNTDDESDAVAVALAYAISVNWIDQYPFDGETIPKKKPKRKKKKNADGEGQKK